jgi:UDP-N-acetylglucosamine--N-acetylmuramyl-(pentapeptide) pyrophosphoryl-undecaprenol N-acetylglucosamine transferase
VKKFLISCGGTGGHLSPGIALAEGLRARGHQVTLLISRKRVDARLSEKYPDLDFVRVPGTGFSWQPFKLARCLVTQVRGFAFCLRLGRQLRPDGIVGFGGFTSAPIVLAGRMLGVPVALHESNRVPGLAIRALGRLARRVYLPPGVHLDGVRAAFTRHVGLPLRREMVRLPQAAARATLGLEPNQKVLAILGGSQGASALNDWARRELPALTAEGIQVYCVTGLGKGEPEARVVQARNGAPIRVVFAPFCDRMAELLSAADLVVSRAGAGTLAELIRCVTPAILVPFPQAADDHQRANAAFFERQAAGMVVEQARLGGLHAEVLDVIFNDWLLRQFRANLQRMDRANSLDLMLDDLEEITAPPAGVSGAAEEATAA